MATGASLAATVRVASTCGRADQAMAPFERSSARRLASATPHSASTSSVCWPAGPRAAGSTPRCGRTVGRAPAARCRRARRRSPRHDVRVRRRLAQREHRRDAGVGAVEDRGPLVSGPGAEDRGEPLRQLRPRATCRSGAGRSGSSARPVPRAARRRTAARSAPTETYLAVGALVDVVEVGAGVEHVDAPLVLPRAHGHHPVHERGEHGGAVDHGGVDHLALSGGPGLEQRRRRRRRRATCRRRRSRRRG